MTVAELVAELGKLFPKSFSGPEGFDLWTHHYRHALAQFEGPKLRSALDECLANWSSHYAPKPAEIKDKLNIGGGRKAGDWNAREHFEGSKAIQYRLIQDWWRDNQDRIESLVAQIGEDARSTIRYQLRAFVSDKAWREAQRRFLNLPPVYELVTVEDWETIRGRVASQTETVGFGNISMPRSRALGVKQLAETTNEPAL